MSSSFKVHRLLNGLQLEFFDQSNRYFGDYHRVKIVIRCQVALRPEWLTAAPEPLELDQLRALLGDCVTFERSLEQMGVASAQLETVKNNLIDGFLKTTAGYLGSEGFPGRFILQQWQARSQRPQRFRPFSS